MPKGHSGSHYNNLSFLQLLVSCSVVKFNLRRVNRIFPPNASLLTIINLLLSTKRALLRNETEDPRKTSGKHWASLHPVSPLPADLSLCVCLCAQWGPSRRGRSRSRLPGDFSLQWQKEAYLTVVYTLYSSQLPVGLAFSLKEELLGLFTRLLFSLPLCIPAHRFLFCITWHYCSLSDHTVLTTAHSRGRWLCNIEKKTIYPVALRWALRFSPLKKNEMEN